MPELTGILESSLYVDDLSRSAAFYRALFGFETLVSEDRLCALAVAGRQALLLFKKGGSLDHVPPHGGTGQLHLAFSVPEADLPAWELRLAAAGVPIETRTHWERGGQSLFFRDPDGHLIELVTPGCWAIY